MSINYAYNNTFSPDATERPVIEENIREEPEILSKYTRCQFGTKNNLEGHIPETDVIILAKKRGPQKSFRYLVKPSSGENVLGIAHVPSKELRKITKTTAQLYSARYYKFTNDPKAPKHHPREEDIKKLLGF